MIIGIKVILFSHKFIIVNYKNLKKKKKKKVNFFTSFNLLFCGMPCIYGQPSSLFKIWVKTFLVFVWFFIFYLFLLSYIFWHLMSLFHTSHWKMSKRKWHKVWTRGTIARSWAVVNLVSDLIMHCFYWFILPFSIISHGQISYSCIIFPHKLAFHQSWYVCHNGLSQCHLGIEIWI